VRYVTEGFSQHEIKQAVQIQIVEINQGFLSSLGEKALGLIFEHVSASPWGIMVLAIDDNSDKVIGYVLGTLSSGKLYFDFIIKRLPYALVYFLPRLLSLNRIKKAIETLLYPSKKQAINLPSAELLDLAVNGLYHGKGVAKGLFLKLNSEFQRRGIDSFRIPTSASLIRAHRFYEKMGATKVGAFELHQGELTIVYVYRSDRPIGKDLNQ
jgi:GNAT superfamily N-acetyltransferase